jgi:uncharacterized membrane protein YfcA
MYYIISSIIIGLLTGIIKGWHKMPINQYIVMFLLLFNIVNDKTQAMATVSFIVMALSFIQAFTMYKNNKKHNINIVNAIIILLTILIGNHIGEYMSNYISTKITNTSIIIGFILTTIYFLKYFNLI